MNNIFIKNLTALKQKNPELTQELQKYIPTELPKIVQLNNAYNIEYKNTIIHHQTNPLAEAHQIFDSSVNTPVSIHIVYGLGLGYLFQVASLKSQGTVILYEPDLNILWFAFTLVDFSEDILKENVYIASTIEMLSGYIYKKSGIKNSPVVLSLPSQRNFNPEKFDEIIKQLQNTVASFSLDLKFTQYKLYPSLIMLLKNLPNLHNEYPLARYKDIYKDKTAVVVSAGPTLDRNIETLKKYRDRFVLFTVGTAVKTLYANDIKPDFLCIIETYNSSRQVEGLDLSEVNFITEPYANPALRNYKYKNIYSHISSNSPINNFWAEICEEENDEYCSRGTVSYTALNCARLLGCSKIILVGQDLAYIEGQCYSKDSAYKDLCCTYNNEKKCWEITAKDFEQFAKAISPSPDPITRENTALERLKNLNSALYYVKGINGEQIPTESVYSTFIKPLYQYTQVFNDREYINTSLVGAQIDGFKNLSLEEALKNVKPIEKIELGNHIKLDKEKISNNLKAKLSELKTAFNIIDEGEKLTKNIQNNIKRYRTINEEILKTLRKVTENYLDLTNNLANSSKLLELIITEYKIDLDYEMKMLKEFNLQNVSNINNKLSQFYKNIKYRIQEVDSLMGFNN